MKSKRKFGRSSALDSRLGTSITGTCQGDLPIEVEVSNFGGMLQSTVPLYGISHDTKELQDSV